MKNKRKRGANYTSQETKKLLELVHHFNYAIDDKRTGAIHLAHKKEAWEKVCAAYNAIATSGIRSVEQLKVLYDNKKQKARKVLAEKNGEYSKTEGEGQCSAVTDHNLQILNSVNDRVTPLPNCCNSEALYIEEHTTHNTNLDTQMTLRPSKTINRRRKLNQNVTSKVKNKINYKEFTLN